MKTPLKIYLQIAIKGDSILYLDYNNESDEYIVRLKDFHNMEVNLKLLQLSKMLYQLGGKFINEDGSRENCFLNRQELMSELTENNCSCEVADVKNDNILIYRRSQDDIENFSADGMFMIGPFIPEYLQNDVSND